MDSALRQVVIYLQKGRNYGRIRNQESKNYWAVRKMDHQPFFILGLKSQGPVSQNNFNFGLVSLTCLSWARKTQLGVLLRSLVIEMGRVSEEEENGMVRQT